jgi:hypothetical protein
MGNSTLDDYIIRSKLTGAGRNGILGAHRMWDYLAAHHHLTIFWKFVPKDLYFNKEMFSDKLKVGILFCNVWFFFIRRNSLPRCLSNLMSTFDNQKVKELGVKTKLDIRFTCEIIFI